MPSANGWGAEAAGGPPRRVLITGIGGFVASHAAQAFARAGWTVRGSTRGGGRAETRARPVPPGVEVVETGPFGAGTDWAPALDGVDAVVHLAARVHDVATPPDDARRGYAAVNVRATERLAEAAVRAGVRRFVFVSSIGVNGHATGAQPFRETDPAAPVTPYARSKWRAEQLLDDLARRGCLQVVRLRFPLVYGPGAPGNFGRLSRLVRSRWPLPLGAVRNRRSLLFVGNAADVLVRAAAHPAASGLFMVSDGEEISTPELVRRLGKLLGVRTRLFTVDSRALRRIGRVAGRAAEVEGLVSSLVVDSSAARERLEWHPPWSLAEGLERSVP